MAMQQRLGDSLSENLITLLGHSDEFGKIVYTLLDTQLLEGNYRIIGERFSEYWRQFGTAPKLHAGDLFDDVFADKMDRRGNIIRRMLKQMISLNEGINAVYVLKQLQLFNRQQSIKDAILKAADILSRASETSLDEVEEILFDITKARQINFNPGMKLDAIERIQAHLQRESTEFITGIGLLDKAGIVPMRQRVMLMLGGKGRGKSWWLVNCGRRAIDLRHKVVHISLENSEEETAVRYWQAIWAIPKHEAESVKTTVFERDKHTGEVLEWKRELVPVEFDFASPELHYEMQTRVEMMGAKMNNLRIKHFPSGSLTVRELEAYLDMLERVENFIPDMMIIDYPRLMKIDLRNPRMSIGQNLVGIRAIAQERNLAAVVVDQLSREGNKAASAKATHVGEDWSQVLTGDMVLVHSMTDWEKSIGLGRLYVEHARSEEDKFTLLLTHNYKTGQFALDSALMPDGYLNMIASEESEQSAEYADSEGEIERE